MDWSLHRAALVRAEGFAADLAVVCRRRHFLSRILIPVLALSMFGFAGAPDVARAQEEAIVTAACDYTPSDVIGVLDAAKAALRADPMAEALAPYISVLDQRANEFRQFDAEARNWLSRCGAARGEAAVSAVLAERAPLERRGAAIIGRAQEVVTVSEFMLSHAGTQATVWLYARRVAQSGMASCAALARIADAAEDRTTSSEDLIHTLESVLGSRDNARYRPDPASLLALSSIVQTSGLEQIDFGDEGFRPEFRLSGAGWRDNQVRHAIAYLRIGYDFNDRAAALASYINDRVLSDQQADYALAVAAGRIGWELRRGVLGRAFLAARIRERLCAS